MSTISLPVEVVASVLENLHGSGCTFFACPGVDEPPVDGATCSHHWAYHDLHEAVSDRIKFRREGHAPISLDTYLSLMSVERYKYEVCDGD